MTPSKRVCDLLPEIQLGSHRVLEVLLSPEKRDSLRILQPVALLGHDVMLERLDTALYIN